MKGNNVTTDNFDSSNPQLSTNGQYDPTKTSTNGDIASVGGVVNVDNANVNGEVLLGPTASQTQLKNGFVSGGVTNDFNVSFPDVLLPGGSPLPAINLPVTIDGTTYDYAFATSGYYQIDNLSGSIYVAPGANVTLLLTGTATSQYIRVASAGGVSGNLAIYMNGPTFTLSGNDTIVSANALNFQYYGTTSNTQVKFTGNASFTGTIYAPEAAFSMGGGGSSNYDFVGSSYTLSATVNGHFNFHYDQNLSNGPRRGFVPTSWQEL